MSFERFTHTGRRCRCRIIVDGKHRQIILNRAFMERYAVDCEAAVLYFDAKSRQIGIEPVGDMDCSWAVRMSRGAQGQGAIRSASFFRWCGLCEHELYVGDPSVQFYQGHRMLCILLGDDTRLQRGAGNAARR